MKNIYNDNKDCYNCRHTIVCKYVDKRKAGNYIACEHWS